MAVHPPTTTREEWLINTVYEISLKVDNLARRLEEAMSAIDDIKDVADKVAAVDQSVATTVTRVVTDLENLEQTIANLQTGTNLSAADAATLKAAHDQVAASVADMTSQLSTLNTAAASSEPPTPAPTP